VIYLLLLDGALAILYKGVRGVGGVIVKMVFVVLTWW